MMKMSVSTDGSRSQKEMCHRVTYDPLGLRTSTTTSSFRCWKYTRMIPQEWVFGPMKIHDNQLFGDLGVFLVEKKGMNITMSQFKITCDMFLGMRDRATRLPTQPSGDSALGRSPAAQGIQFPTHASCNGLENHGSMSSMSSMGHCVHVLSHPNNSGAQKDNELQDLRRKYVF